MAGRERERERERESEKEKDRERQRERWRGESESEIEIEKEAGRSYEHLCKHVRSIKYSVADGKKQPDLNRQLRM
jgi:hypothetical protein